MDEQGGAVNRFYICATCITSIAKMDGSPVLRVIRRGEQAFAADVKPVPPRLTPEREAVEDADEIAEAVMAKLVAHEKAKDQARMAKARAAKTRRGADDAPA
jgi:hypothetical protein